MIDLPVTAIQAITWKAAAIIDDAVWSIEHKEVVDFESAFRFVYDTFFDDSLAISLTVDEQLTVIECEGHHHGVQCTDLSINALRRQIEQATCLVLGHMAQARAHHLLNELQALMTKHHFDFDSIVSTNRFAWARHFAEDMRDDCQIYQYRNVEGIHVDVWEYPIGSGKLYLEEPIDAADVSAAERLFVSV